MTTKKVWLPDRRTDGRTDRHAGQSDPYVPLCFAGNTKMHQHQRVTYKFSAYQKVSKFLYHQINITNYIMTRMAALKGMQLCCLWNIKTFTTKKMPLLDRKTDGQTAAWQSDPYVLPCFAGDSKICKCISHHIRQNKIVFFLCNIIPIQ